MALTCSRWETQVRSKQELLLVEKETGSSSSQEMTSGWGLWRENFQSSKAGVAVPLGKSSINIKCLSQWSAPSGAGWSKLWVYLHRAPGLVFLRVDPPFPLSSHKVCTLNLRSFHNYQSWPLAVSPLKEPPTSHMQPLVVQRGLPCKPLSNSKLQ